MDWNSPISCTYDFDVLGPFSRFLLFFGHYDCRVYLSPTAYIDVGAGSLGCAGKVSEVSLLLKGSLGSIGRYCEFAKCEIMAWGEHDHSAPVNIGFASAAMLSWRSAQAGHPGIKSSGRISIGNGVVISAGAMVLPGVAIGDGVAIGAGAVVNRPIEPFSVAVGVPAKVKKKRFDAATCKAVAVARWWDFSAAYLAEHMDTIQEVAARPGAHRYMAERPRFVIEQSATGVTLRGFLDGEIERPLSAAPEAVQAYAKQAFGPGPYLWIADCWAT